MLRAVFRSLSPAGPRSRLSILIFHRVLERPDPLFPETIDTVRFDAICRWLGKWFHVVALDDAVRRLQNGTLPERALAITFDDGYADNHGFALPILERHGMRATFFVATGYLDGGCMWNDLVIEALRKPARESLDLSGVLGESGWRIDLSSLALRREAIDRLLGQLKYRSASERHGLALAIARVAGVSVKNGPMMTGAQVRDLRRRGMQIGAHTTTHPILARLDSAAARSEVQGSKRTLETLVDERIGLFAYPNGKRNVDFDDGSMALVREAGFDAALSTDPGAAIAGAELFALPRFTPWDRTRLRFGFRLARNLLASRPNSVATDPALPRARARPPA